MLPFTYATRNLLRDPSRLLQKTAGAALVVFLVMAAASFDSGMTSVLSGSGSPKNIILLGSGSEDSVERSQIAPQVETQAAAGVRDVADILGRPAVSGEVHYMGQLEFTNHPPAQALLRGVTPAAFGVHQRVQVTEGHFPGPGEVMVGRLAHRALELPASDLHPGSEVIFEGQTFTVSGVFAAHGTVMESEVWFDRSDLMTLTQRNTLSCVVLRMKDADGLAAADLFAKQRFDLELVALRESDYYAGLSRFYGPIRSMAWITALLIATGAVFGGLNMLYAAFASRIREMATLQAIGFSRPALFLSILQESLLATLVGTLLASWASLLFLDGLSINFSLGTFQLTITGTVAFAGLATGILLGIVGAIPPAIRCLHVALPSALRS